MIDRSEPKLEVSNKRLPSSVDTSGHDLPFVDQEQLDCLQKHFRCSVV